MFAKVLLTFALLSIHSIVCVKSEDKISVVISNGVIDGKREVIDGRELDVFVGIPYAQPPVNRLRFRKPLPVLPWKGSIDATHWPKSCIHKKVFHNHYFNKEMSEDCLYLNIWSPGSDKSTGALKPVMFFIHGGGLVFGSSVEKYYSGHMLSTKGDVVVVTFNYRLGALGLLYNGGEEAPGNMALWDQALALEWVNENIRYFGGDSNRITVFGESAGGWSTSAHVLSPITRNLFQNAIIMSGAVISDKTVCPPETVHKTFVDYSLTMGCSDSENPNKLTSKVVDCLIGIPPEKFAQDPLLGLCMSNIVMDGQFMPDIPINMLKSGDYKKDINLIIGTAGDEGSPLLSFIADPVKYSKHSPPEINLDQALNDQKQLFSYFIPGIASNIESLSKIYFNGLPENSGSDLLRRTIGISFGDYLLSCPTVLFAEAIHQYINNSNVYQYYYNYKSKTETLYCSEWMGVCHFDDIYPVFGIPFTDVDRYEDKDREISTNMIEIFSTFAKTGKPSLIDKTIDWHKYFKIDSKVIAPYYEVSNESKFGHNLKLIECEYLFKKYII